jgi:uncharacterized cupredoxin-like copper-binding protein
MTISKAWKNGMVFAVAALAFGLARNCAAMAAGNLAAKCARLPELVFGTDPAGYKVSQDAYELETGKCYRLMISSTGNKEYALRGEQFFRNIWLRKIEAGGMEIKAHTLYELEFENEAKAEIFFVPIQEGSYKLSAAGLEDKGTLVTFNVK